jgi:hypothetical protein
MVYTTTILMPDLSGGANPGGELPTQGMDKLPDGGAAISSPDSTESLNYQIR